MKPVELFAYMVAFSGGVVVLGLTLGVLYLGFLFLRGMLIKR